MEVVFVLIPVSLLIVIVAIWAFVWSVRTDQYEDLEKEAFRILIDEELIDEGFGDVELDEEAARASRKNLAVKPNSLNPCAGGVPAASLIAVCPEFNPNNDRSAS
jgi:cbb3-type cytochrome oxidase maturation protein